MALLTNRAHEFFTPEDLKSEYWSLSSAWTLVLWCMIIFASRENWLRERERGQRERENTERNKNENPYTHERETLFFWKAFQFSVSFLGCSWDNWFSWAGPIWNHSWGKKKHTHTQIKQLKSKYYWLIRLAKMLLFTNSFD